MTIQKVVANPLGGFVVTMNGRAPVALPARGDSDADKALAAWFMAGGKAESWTPSLDALKEEALATARQSALALRAQIAGSSSAQRAVGWLLKSLFAHVWQINEAAENPQLAPLASIAADGFQREADLTGEVATDIRDRCVAKAGAYFLALQLIEGMERVAEDKISAATTAQDLTQTIAQLRDLDAQARANLATLTQGGTNA